MTRKPKRIALVLAASALAATGCSDEDLCKNTVCGQNAFCDTASGDCVCDSGYTSNDPARGCAEPTTCEVDSCSNHGSCSVNDGAIVCSCDQGYAAPTCANCATDHTQEGGACIDSKQVACTDAAPPNATSTPAQVTIIYTTAGGWTTPAACAWTCDQDYQQSGDACVPDSCPVNYCNGHGTCAMASGIPTCTCDEGYATPTCSSCATDYTHEGGACISSKQVACTDAAPTNGTSTPAQVTITYTTAGGWTSPEACAWTCNQGYQQSGNACVLDSCPANYCNGHGTCAMPSGNPTCTCHEGYATPTCSSCATDYTYEGDACISSKQVACTDAAPANATSTPGQVTITYTTAGGWTTPAACAWTCDRDHELVGGTCVSSGEGEGEECSVEQSYGTVVPTWSYAESRDGHIVADFDINDDRDTVRFELFAGYGAFAGGPVRTGVYTISGDDLDYDTCGLCVSLYGDEYSANHYITGGTVTISSVSGRLTGTLSNATFEEVTIDDATLEPTPVPNGCRSAITSMAFDTVLE